MKSSESEAPIKSVNEIPEEVLEDFETLDEFLKESGYVLDRIEYLQ